MDFAWLCHFQIEYVLLGKFHVSCYVTNFWIRNFNLDLLCPFQIGFVHLGSFTCYVTIYLYTFHSFVFLYALSKLDRWTWEVIMLHSNVFLEALHFIVLHKNNNFMTSLN